MCHEYIIIKDRNERLNCIKQNLNICIYIFTDILKRIALITGTGISFCREHK